MGALGPRRLPGLSELYFAGWSGTAATKPAKDSNYEPGFLNDKCGADRGVFDLGWIRRAARQDFSGGADCSRQGATWRGVRRIRPRDPTRLWNILF